MFENFKDLGLMSQVELERRKWTCLSIIMKELWLDDIHPSDEKLRFMTDGLTSNIISKFSCQFWTRSEGKYQFEWYSSWWQELRNKIFPRWYLRKYPSKKEVKQIVHAQSAYPSLRYHGKEHKAVLSFTKGL